jgi:hypothetical protein
MLGWTGGSRERMKWTVTGQRYSLVDGGRGADKGMHGGASQKTWLRSYAEPTALIAMRAQRNASRCAGRSQVGGVERGDLRVESRRQRVGG